MVFMKTTYHYANAGEKESIGKKITECLSRHSDILFAYLHGSFFESEKFRDIDIAVYLAGSGQACLQRELALEEELSRAVKKYRVEVRILNQAPLSFRYNVIRHGSPVLSRADERRTDFVEATLRNYFDFTPFRKMYLKEVLGSGV
jgi:predicted nucleotidyltransferase